MEITGPNDNSWSFRKGEEFRERVIRQAMLLGFEAEEYSYSDSMLGRVGPHQKRWRFKNAGEFYGSYASCYSAALEFLRLNNFPMDKVGRIND